MVVGGAVAVLLATGLGYAAIAWREGRYLGAIALGLCLLAGEAYWLATNAERELAAREVKAAPMLAAQQKRNGAVQRVKEAEDAKKVADAAAISEAPKPGCKANCAALLIDAKNRADKELTTAREVLDTLPAVRAYAALPERIGMAPWAWDLLMAGLRSLAVIGGSLAIALALHPK